MMGGTPNGAPYKRPEPPLNAVMNHGKTTVLAMDRSYESADRQACMHSDNPFFYIGK
jgi:hypothetical protein